MFITVLRMAYVAAARIVSETKTRIRNTIAFAPRPTTLVTLLAKNRTTEKNIDYEMASRTENVNARKVRYVFTLMVTSDDENPATFTTFSSQC
jgi:hypothetical protein